MASKVKRSLTKKEEEIVNNLETHVKNTEDKSPVFNLKKAVSAMRKNRRKSGDSGSDYGQFFRAKERKRDNYRLKLSDINFPTKLKLDKEDRWHLIKKVTL